MNIDVNQIIKGMNASDGAGVRLKRYIGTPDVNMHDPFLLFDVFESDNPDDYIAGFPPHPHRGFETVTYMLAGKMRHEDSAGHAGVIETGDVQWMTAASGIIHSEMPEQTEGRLSGVQLWLNLPANEKMSTPKYQEYASNLIPLHTLEGVSIKSIANASGIGPGGIISKGTVEPIYWHVSMEKDAIWTQTMPETHSNLMYVISGAVTINQTAHDIESGELAILSQGNLLTVKAKEQVSFLLIAARPLQEPIARGGPFVMNTRDEIEQAFEDYKKGRFVEQDL